GVQGVRAVHGREPGVAGSGQRHLRRLLPHTVDLVDADADADARVVREVPQRRAEAGCVRERARHDQGQGARYPLPRALGM
ncbi:unnamed protein product, partial [Urochloa humidicola]